MSSKFLSVLVHPNEYLGESQPLSICSIDFVHFTIGVVAFEDDACKQFPKNKPAAEDVPVFSLLLSLLKSFAGLIPGTPCSHLAHKMYKPLS